MEIFRIFIYLAVGLVAAVAVSISVLFLSAILASISPWLAGIFLVGVLIFVWALIADEGSK